MKKNIMIALLLGLGLIFSQIMPPLLAGMRFDFLLCFMFIALVLSRDFKSALLIGLLGGIFSALVSSFPGGQLPNLLEKLLVSIYIYGVLKIRTSPLKTPGLVFISLTGTILSGSLFLGLAKLIIGLPVDFTSLFFTVVLPASLVNTVGTVFIYGLIRKAIKYSNFQLEDI